MADTSDVQNALVSVIDSIVYPSGDFAQAAVAYPCRIYRGWPTAPDLDPDLLAGWSHITVFEQAGYNRLTGGYIDPKKRAVTAPPTLTVSVAGPTVTIGGTVTGGQLVGVLVDDTPYVYTVQTSDTTATVAAGLAALANATNSPLTDNSGNPIAGLSTTGYGIANGPSVTFATNLPVTARVGGYGTVQSFDRWQCQGYRLTFWTPSPEARDALCSLVDANLAKTRWLPLPDGQSGRLEWKGTFTDDIPQREALWRRDLMYTVQYATSLTTVKPQMLWGMMNVSPSIRSTGVVTGSPIQTIV